MKQYNRIADEILTLDTFPERFWIMHIMQKNGFNPRDVEHWKSKGWTENLLVAIVL